MKKELAITLTRYEKMEWELKHALGKTSNEEYKKWALYTSLVFPQIAVRRVKNLGEFAGKIAKGTYSEAKDLVNASIKWKLGEHTKQRANDLITFSKESLKDFKELTSIIKNMIKNDPKKAAIKIFAATMGFNVGGGGIDGDGGIPDIDLMVSIGAHRSIFTHSVLPMIFFEGLFLGMIGLVKIIHKNLPADHDPLWDDIKNNNEEFLEIFYNGMSTGIIYHLGFDATIDGGGTYKNLPFSMPQYGHQILGALNSLTELVDIKSKSKKMVWKNIK